MICWRKCRRDLSFVLHKLNITCIVNEVIFEVYLSRILILAFMLTAKLSSICSANIFHAKDFYPASHIDC